MKTLLNRLGLSLKLNFSRLTAEEYLIKKQLKELRKIATDPLYRSKNFAKGRYDNLCKSLEIDFERYSGFFAEYFKEEFTKVQKLERNATNYSII